MSQSHNPSYRSSGMKPKRLRNLYEELDLFRLLEVNDPFALVDVAVSADDRKAMENTLIRDGVIEHAGRRVYYESGRDGTPVQDTTPLYSMPRDVREFLEDYRNSFDRLPCGHRVHIHHNAAGDLACRYCGSYVSPSAIEEADHL